MPLSEYIILTLLEEKKCFWSWNWLNWVPRRSSSPTWARSFVVMNTFSSRNAGLGDFEESLESNPFADSPSLRSTEPSTYPIVQEVTTEEPDRSPATTAPPPPPSQQSAVLGGDDVSSQVAQDLEELEIHEEKNGSEQQQFVGVGKNDQLAEEQQQEEEEGKENRQQDQQDSQVCIQKIDIVKRCGGFIYCFLVREFRNTRERIAAIFWSIRSRSTKSRRRH